MQTLEFERQHARLEALADIRSGTEKLSQLVERHAALDSVLLPIADEVYNAMKIANEAGLLSFTNLLDAERSLIELRFAHNDVLLTIREEIIALERLTGVVLSTTSK